jgi:hypothetical protein
MTGFHRRGKENTKIVSPHFHYAIVKVQNEDTLLLTPMKAAAASCLRKDDGEQVAEVDVPGEHEDANLFTTLRSTKNGRSE